MAAPHPDPRTKRTPWLTLLSLVDGFLPPHAREDADSRQRGRILVVIHVFLVTNAAFFAAATATKGLPLPSFIAAGTALTGAILLHRLPKQPSLTPPTHGIVVVIFAFIAATAMFSGGWGTPPLNWFPILPLAATLASGVRAGALAALLGAGGYLLFYLLDVFGVDTSSSDGEAVRAIELPDRLLLVGTSLLLAWAYESLKRRALGELAATTRQLEREVEGHLRTRQRLDQAREEVLRSARQSGMAEIATGILHDAGNALNHVTTSSSLLFDHIRAFPITQLDKAATLFRDVNGVNPERLKLLSEYLDALAREAAVSHVRLVEEVGHLRHGLEQVCSLVTSHGRYATNEQPAEELDIGRTIEDVVQLLEGSLRSRGIAARCEIEPVPALRIRKQKLLQIVLNLLDNAQNAIVEAKRGDGEIKVKLWRPAGDRLCIEVGDNGIGISPEAKSKIFQRGFTTRAGGHGLGLHGAALAAHDLGGELTFHAGDLGAGATFVLTLPVRP